MLGMAWVFVRCHDCTLTSPMDFHLHLQKEEIKCLFRKFECHNFLYKVARENVVDNVESFIM